MATLLACLTPAPAAAAISEPAATVTPAPAPDAVPDAAAPAVETRPATPRQNAPTAYQAPPECPTEQALLGELARDWEMPLTALPMAVRITKRDDGYHLELEGIGAPSHAQSCQELVSLAAFAIHAAMLDAAQSPGPTVINEPSLAKDTTPSSGHTASPSTAHQRRPASRRPKALEDSAIEKKPRASKAPLKTRTRGSSFRPVVEARVQSEASKQRPIEVGTGAVVGIAIKHFRLTVGAALWRAQASPLERDAPLININENRNSFDAALCLLSDSSEPQRAALSSYFGLCFAAIYNRAGVTAKEARSQQIAHYAWTSLEASLGIGLATAYGIQAELRPGLSMTPMPAKIKADPFKTISRRSPWATTLTLQLGYVAEGG